MPLGVQLDVRATDYNRFQDKMRRGSAQIFFWGWNADYPDAENFLFLLYGPNAKAKTGGENAANYDSPEYDKLFEQMKLLDDGPEKERLIARMVAIVQRDAPWMFGYFPMSGGAYQQWVGNAKPTQMVRNILQYMKIDPELRHRKIDEWNSPSGGRWACSRCWRWRSGRRTGPEAARAADGVRPGRAQGASTMIGYVIRRLLYGVLILIGVNLFTFILFFAVNTPDDMARLAIGGQRISQDAVEKWKVEHGYDKPLFYNAEAQGAGRLTDTVFYQRSVPLLAMEFGASDGGRDIGREIRTRMGPSLALAVPTFLLGLFVSIAFSLMLVYFRATRPGFLGRGAVRDPAVDLQPLLHHRGPVVVRQDLAAGAVLGFSGGLDMAKFLALPVLVAIISRLGPGRASTARCSSRKSAGLCAHRQGQGLAERAVLFRHVLRNAMLPILTSTVAALPLLFMGSLIAESFFGIPGLGSYTIDAINAQDFSIVRAMVFLGASLYIVGLILADISYTLADPACVSSSRHAQDRLALDRYRALADGVGGAGLRLVRAPQSGAARPPGGVSRATRRPCVRP